MHEITVQRYIIISYGGKTFCLELRYAIQDTSSRMRVKREREIETGGREFLIFIVPGWQTHFSKFKRFEVTIKNKRYCIRALLLSDPRPIPVDRRRFRVAITPRGHRKGKRSLIFHSYLNEQREPRSRAITHGKYDEREKERERETFSTKDMYYKTNGSRR